MMKANEQKLKVNQERLWERLQHLGEIGADPRGGISLISWTPTYKKACEALMGWMEEAGLKVRMDTVGNIYGKLESDEDLPPILTGSHLDTVPNGGNFDGIAGVMSALEVLTCLSENGYKPRRPIEMIAFVNEEATQFIGGTFGSRAICGMLPDDYVTATIDQKTGITMKQAMLDFGMDLEPDNVEGSFIKEGDYYAFIEVHIEQGKHLLENDLPMAVVTAVAGIKTIFITLNGVADHAGGTSMEDRRDTMAAAASIATEAERLALNTGRPTRGTVGYIKAHPGVHSIIAGETTLSVDFREDDPVIFEGLYTDLMEYVEEQCQEHGLTYSVRYTSNTPPAPSNPKIMEVIGESAIEAGIKHTKMVSYPSHDAKNLSRLYPMGMIFLRGQNEGVSHSPDEFTTLEDITAGATALLKSVVKMAENDIL